MTVWSIGYQRLDVAGLIDTLRADGVEVLLDVRAAPWSQRPEFRREPLAAAIRAAGLRYQHHPAVGNPFRGDDAWRERLEARLAQDPAVVYQLEAICAEAPSVLLCVCPHRARCHRGLLLEIMETRGWQVVDLPHPPQMTLF